MHYAPGEPVFAGGTNGSYIFEHQKVAAAGQLPSHSFDEHIFMFPVGDVAVSFSSRLNGRPVNGLIEPGRFRFVAAGDTLSTTWDAPLEAIFITLPLNVLNCALGEEAHDPPAQLRSNIMPHDDPLLAHLTLAMQSYIRSNRIAGRIFEQSLLTAIAVHLLMSYGHGKRGRSPGESLTRLKRTCVEEYIRQNLSRDLSLAGISAVIHMTPHQLSRTYRATTGQSLWQFVIECRAREAMRMLSHNRSPSLPYVAHACGFESYSQFIAAFRKLFGQLPSEYRRSRYI